MSVAVHANSPAVKIGNGAATTTTASFNAPRGTLLVAMVATDNVSSTPPAPTVSDSKVGSWSSLVSSSTANQGVAAVWARWVQDGEIGLTVSVTFTNAFNSAADAILAVQVLTGASKNQSGTTGTASGTVDTIAIIPQEIGSLVFGALSRTAGATSYVANAQSTAIGLNADATSSSTQWAFKGAAVTSSLASVTYGSSTAAVSSANIAAVEIRPSNGLNNNYQFVTVGDGMWTGDKIR